MTARSRALGKILLTTVPGLVAVNFGGLSALWWFLLGGVCFAFWSALDD